MINKSKTFTNGKVLVALNVRQDATSKTFIADESHRGDHWTLLALDTQTKNGYYGDSLKWAIPNDLENVVEPLLQKINFNLKTYNIVDSSNDFFYPVQTCSNMCGIIVLCMAAVMCGKWDQWLEWNNTNAPLYLLRPSDYSKHLRLNVISWLVEDKVDLNNITQDQSNQKQAPPTNLKIHTDHSDSEHSELESDDELDEHGPHGSTDDITAMLPGNYDYKLLKIIKYENTESFHCTFKIKLSNEEAVRKWLAAYSEKTKETMVYECCKSGKGERVVKKFYLRCQHKQRQTGKHSKSDRVLKTTHKSHNNKHTNCPAQIIATLLAPRKNHHGFCTDIVLKHNHNHLVHVADALRFRRMSQATIDKYYDLFRQGHSPSTAHLEYETNIMYCDEPHLIADRSTNPKVSDVYNLFNKWRKCNVGVRTGKQLFTELEKRIHAYNDTHNEIGGKAVVQRYQKGTTKCQEELLILAFCTPLMSRVHKYIQQSKELVFIDASSSFEDFNNPLFVISTSSAAGGLPLGVIITSGESASTVHKGMTMLQDLLPTSAFYNNGSPKNIMIDDSSAEMEGLHQTWPNSNIFLCIFHFLQSMWRWLLYKKHDIHMDDRQYLMALIRKLVYAKTESELLTEYHNFENDSTVTKYKNFASHVKQYWARRKEWAVCFRNAAYMRGINTNNYAESGIRILKDIVFRRVKAYNLVQLFEFITVTFELYYVRRLLAIAYNRMDRFISLRYKGLGAQKINPEAIEASAEHPHIYLVGSTYYNNKSYEVDTQNWTCSCTAGRTGYPSGEPCKHQHAVAKKHNLTAPNLIPYFNAEGRYLHALVAVGVDKAGDKAFYFGMTESDKATHKKSLERHTEHKVDQSCTGEDYLEVAVNTLQEHESLKIEVTELGNHFITDVEERMEQLDIQYLNGLKKFFNVYLETVALTEPTSCATPKLASLLHTYFSAQPSIGVAGTRHMKVQPTALSRRRPGISKGNKLAPSGRPPKRCLDEDPNIQTKRGRSDHTKRKQNLRQNELKNQANHFKHGVGH